MRRLNFILPKYGWRVSVFMPVESVDVSAIMESLSGAGISYTNLRDAYDCIMKEEFNCGFTYSNPSERRSVMVVGVASNASELYDTLQHEQTHLAMNIAEEFEIDVGSEEFAYLVGDISRLIFPYAEPFLCDNCRRRAMAR